MRQREGKNASESPARLLPNARLDIYPGRLWAVAAAALTEMIQPAVQKGIYSDGCRQLGSRDVLGMWGVVCLYCFWIYQHTALDIAFI